MVPANKKAPSLEDEHSTKNGGMCTLIHEIVSSKLYELLIKTELNGDTTMDLKNFYNPINICIHTVLRRPSS